MIRVTEQLNATLVPLIPGLLMQIKIILKKIFFIIFQQREMMELWIYTEESKVRYWILYL